MKAPVFTIPVLVMLSSASVMAQQAIPFAGDRNVTVMTQNVYNGVDAELSALPTAKSFSDLLNKVATVYKGYFDRKFPERAAALAAEIEAKRPDFIGLQEAILVRTQTPPDGPKTPATTVALDYVQILLDALAKRGLKYKVVVQSINLDVELPSDLGIDVRHTDREVILARADLKTADLKLSNAQGGNFVTNCIIPSPITGPITLQRGWVAVDAKIRGKSLRLISTHLDAACLPSPDIQQKQVVELLNGPAATQLPVVLLGDFNSPGDGSGEAYNDLFAAGFADAAFKAGVGSIPTCCQNADLLNSVSALNSRIDFVLFRGTIKALSADVVGDNSADRTPSGLWPSDHAGVAATLVFP
ncbi:MAG: endonuclease/exonuclease/phosphatase family protein [Aulosira sp. ZfuVER01]|nr:endonuclease/exonuclease/phosphatase family protein [Aulosira sp. ZfuVER01]MDZ8000419.1 endonuclease/exonuclease/phosphatase family protein [Aulosira sp. DedVER01a]MDZ8052891.1 endonuclease/exonuclease/phosphatase family protein [Aulosira sp. ZfuCHP01]